MARKIKRRKGSAVYEPDWFIKGVSETTEYIRDNYVTLVVAVAAILVALLALYLVSASASAKKSRSSDMFSRAMAAMNGQVLDPANLQTQIGKDVFETETKKYEEAVKRLKEIQDVFPKSVEARLVSLQLGTAYLRLGEYDKAISELEASRALLAGQKDFIEMAELNIAKAYIGKDKPDEAIPRLKKLSNNEGGLLRGQATFLLAHALEKSGNLDQALKSYQKLDEEFSAVSFAQNVSLKIAILKRKLGITDEDAETEPETEKKATDEEQ